MIRSFKHKGLKRLYEKGDPSLIRHDLMKTVREILTLLDAATKPQDLNLAGYRLHPLRGDRKGFRAVTVRANWRVVFTFEDSNAVDVELVDYH